MGQEQNQSKVYLETFEKIKAIIQEQNLKPGDKLPSERELADILQVGRSSVREALRSMELLGLIETRRGEGTFVVDFRKHQLVELLGSFVLQREHVDDDILEVKKIIEQSSIYKLIFTNSSIDMSQWIEKKEINREQFFEQIILRTNNKLLLTIWLILSNFISTMQIIEKKIDQKEYMELITAINRGNWNQALSIYSISFEQVLYMSET